MGKRPKDFLSGSENVLKNLTTEMVRLCTEQNVFVKPEVVSLAISLLCLDPENDLTLDAQLDRGIVEKFVKKYVNKFIEKDHPFFKALELQVSFMEKSSDLGNIEQLIETRANTKSELLLQDILEFEAQGTDDQDKLFKKIVIDMIVSNKLGKPNKEQVIIETTNALKSIFSRTDLIEFIKSKRRKRIETLSHLRQLVCGIRLFNKDAGHCGEGVRDIIEDVRLGFENSKKALGDALFSSKRRVNSISNALKGIFNYEMTFEIFQIINEDDLEFLKDLLALNYQHQEYINVLMDLLNEHKSTVDKYFDKFKTTLENLHDVVKFRIAVATEQVFPHFITLSSVWKSLMTYLYILVEVNELNDEMQRIIVSCKSYENLLYSVLKKLKDDKQQKIEHAESLHVTHPECKIVNISRELKIVPLSKFCAYLFIFGNGVLIPAEQHLGLLQYKNYLFGFSKSAYVNEFSENIENSVTAFLETVRRNPIFIVYFELFDEVTHLQTKEEMIEEESETERIDVEIQTELHPIPFHKDKDYTWNIWDLRRKAIQLANIKKCNTHSFQTEISYHRTCSRLQTFELKEQCDQTMRTIATSTIKNENLELGKLPNNTNCLSKTQSTSTSVTEEDELSNCPKHICSLDKKKLEK